MFPAPLSAEIFHTDILRLNWLFVSFRNKCYRWSPVCHKQYVGDSPAFPNRLNAARNGSIHSTSKIFCKLQDDKIKWKHCVWMFKYFCQTSFVDIHVCLEMVMSHIFQILSQFVKNKSRSKSIYEYIWVMFSQKLYSGFINQFNWPRFIRKRVTSKYGNK